MEFEEQVYKTPIYGPIYVDIIGHESKECIRDRHQDWIGKFEFPRMRLKVFTEI